MAAPDKRAVSLPLSKRRYITFNNPTRTLHQSIGKNSFDVRQWVFESARVMDCHDADGTVTNLGTGWLCATIVQTSEAGASGAAQGCMSVDIVADNGTHMDNMFVQGNVVSNKTVSSAVSLPGVESNAVLLTLVSTDAATLHLTKVEHVSATAPRSVVESESQSSGLTQIPSTGMSSLLAASDERRRDKEKEKDRDRDRDKDKDDERRRKCDMNGGIPHRDRTGGPSTSSSIPLSSVKSKDRRRIEEDCSPRGGEAKRSKHHDPRTDRDSETGRSGGNTDGNLNTDAVSFLNKFSSSTVTPGSDGALPSPLSIIEAPGFTDLIQFEEDADGRRSSAVPTETAADQQQRTGTDGGIVCSRDSVEFAHTSPRSTDSGSEGAGMTSHSPGHEHEHDEHEHEQQHENDVGERHSNADVPPNPQIEEDHNPPFDGVFKSLMRLLNECKDKSGGLGESSASTSASSDPVPGPSRMPDPVPGPSRMPDRPREEVGQSYAFRGFFERPTVDPFKPVCEIRPFIDMSRVEHHPNPRSRGSGNTGTRRRGRGQPRRNGRLVRERNAENTPRETRGRGRRAASRRGPLLTEDGLEIIEPVAAPSVTEEETERAAALLEELVELDDGFI
ncbi:E112-113 [Murid betaherpesvirus 8]|uniref:E112-113 n=2 Tax=Rat cytomegalovirus (isolate England) TaxID=1261657 RepID=K7XR42_RCMVE|nr:E112-113 [Murid betaherpesvirus 8]AFX83421.2 E112-113 [Murid betaherpesvirus 8]WEG71892.1 core protein [Murid betaherpesvirus 8]WPH25282.1 core protein [Murid betaherpesvirus 8]WPH25415.1 core protein [Murid betaherpesvirus 8]